MKRFTAYRRNISQRDTHTPLQKNADHEPQFEGVVWSDGTVTLRWLTACRSTSVWASLADCLNVHGHPEYGTEIVWHDHDEPPQEWSAQVKAWAMKCNCSSCETKAYGIQRHMGVCPNCGDKRCPRAEHHGNECRVMALAKGATP